MFEKVAAICFAIVTAGIILHCSIFRPKMDDLFGKERKLRILDPVRILVLLLTMLLPEQKHSPVGILRKLVYLLAFICFIILLITGFFPLLVLGKSMSGYWMTVHVTAAPIFAVCLAVLVIMCADRSRFDKNYWPWLQRIVHREPLNRDEPSKYELAQKICFWAIMVLAVPLILSIVLSMLPFFGTDEQKLLLILHRYSAMTISLIIIFYTYVIVRAKME